VPDETAPAIAFVTPNAGSPLRNTVAVTVSASDNLSVSSVKFLVDNAILGPDDTAPPYEVAWDTRTVANGSYTLTAIARDGSGNATSSTLSVTVANDTAAPTVAMTSPAQGASLSGSVTLTAGATDDVQVASVQFLVDGVPLGAADVTAPYEAAWLTLAVPNGAHTVTAVARDQAGNAATSASLTVSVANDTTAPVVAVTSPQAGDRVNESVTIRASATDDFAVVSVQFFVDGAALGPADTTAPYEVRWYTQQLGDGQHALTAVARDSAGNVATSASVTVTVDNDNDNDDA
jgi:putative lipoic acid-binding regulatory protein